MRNYQEQQLQQRHLNNASRESTPPPIPPHPSEALSNNLFELDSLLQDLNSAQFIAEVDRRHSAGWMPHSYNITSVVVVVVVVVVVS